MKRIRGGASRRIPLGDPLPLTYEVKPKPKIIKTEETNVVRRNLDDLVRQLEQEVDRLSVDNGLVLKLEKLIEASKKKIRIERRVESDSDFSDPIDEKPEDDFSKHITDRPVEDFEQYLYERRGQYRKQERYDQDDNEERDDFLNPTWHGSEYYRIPENTTHVRRSEWLPKELNEDRIAPPELNEDRTPLPELNENRIPPPERFLENVLPSDNSEESILPHKRFTPPSNFTDDVSEVLDEYNELSDKSDGSPDFVDDRIFEELRRLQKVNLRLVNLKLLLIPGLALLLFLVGSFFVSNLSYDYCYYYC